MKADHLRMLFQYHFDINQKIWDEIITQLSDDQFTKQLPYSVGSVRNQIVHMIDIDKGWFRSLQGERWPGTSNPANFPDRESVREYRDQTITFMKEILNQIDDEKLESIFPPAAPNQVWQFYMHVYGHGIDHRSQLLSMLNQLGVKTFEQDYVLYLFGGTWPSRM